MAQTGSQATPWCARIPHCAFGGLAVQRGLTSSTGHGNRQGEPLNSNGAQIAPTGVSTDAVRCEAGEVTKRVYAGILRSTALIGGSTMVNVALGMARGKAMASLLGPAGV